MRRDKKPEPEASKRDPKMLTGVQTPGQDRETALARAALRPSVQAAITVREYARRAFDTLSLNALVAELSVQAEAASSGDLKRAEGMLLVQAHTLDALFNTLAQRAAPNMGKYLNAAETYLRLALKAQSQCRATLETLALIKNPPPVAFVRQQNIGVNQQVNNGVSAEREATRARETENLQNKLLEAQHDQRVDTTAAGTASQTDPQLEAVGAINRTPNAGGKGHGVKER